MQVYYSDPDTGRTQAPVHTAWRRPSRVTFVK